MQQTNVHIKMSYKFTENNKIKLAELNLANFLYFSHFKKKNCYILVLISPANTNTVSVVSEIHTYSIWTKDQTIMPTWTLTSLHLNT